MNEMKTAVIKRPDGVKIVYDVIGDGPVLMLLHGGGPEHSRQEWHEAGYVDRLKNDYTVITMDIRGHGQSDKPTHPQAYTIQTMCADILAVADACDVNQFIIWGYSFGGNIGRFLATQSERVMGLIIIGIPMGLAAGGTFRDFILDFSAHWQPIIQALQNGAKEVVSLSEEDQAEWQEIDVPLLLAWLTAMLDWGSIEPTDLPCPTLWLSGSENEGTIASIQAYQAQLKTSRVQVQTIKGLNHAQEFSEVDKVFLAMLAFTQTVCNQ
ncbi:MAG: alpha/beta hydrolase [Chloroflexi bacterium]|nr:alpha/beta hydrolase [Chloroflexota bacterium]